MDAWAQVEQALNDADNIERASRYHANHMARLLAGALRAKKVDSEHLVALKRELRGFNITTRKWEEA